MNEFAWYKFILLIKAMSKPHGPGVIQPVTY